MRGAVRWVTLVLVLCVCAAAAVAAYRLAGVSWDNVVSYRSPYVQAELPAARGGSAVASRTVVVIVDGLRYDASRDMKTLESLRSYGADLKLTAPQPSLSYPNWTTLLSGAPPSVSGVVTNWHEGAAPVETLFDTARRAGVSTVFSGPEDFEQLYGVKSKTTATFMKKWDEQYLSGEYIDAALRMARERHPRLIIVHLPDVDEAGHSNGGGSAAYADTVARVDGDLGRLVNGLQDGSTTFLITADHGHIDHGGHGGWEPEVVGVPCVVAGQGVRVGAGDGRSEQVASTVALFAGIASPRFSTAPPLSVIGTPPANGVQANDDELAAFESAYIDIVINPAPGVELARPTDTGTGGVTEARKTRLDYDRGQRLTYGLAFMFAAFVVAAAILLVSRPAAGAAFAGVVGYYAVYNGLFFLVHGYRWSLSAFNSEDLIGQWMNMRIVEAAVALLVGAAIAGMVYPLLRDHPKGPRGAFLAGWLTLGPTVALAVIATFAVQVGWFIWAWGITPTWDLPDLKWAFKYDLDLVQVTAVGFAALLAPLVTYLVGRYHPNVRVPRSKE